MNKYVLTLFGMMGGVLASCNSGSAGNEASVNLKKSDTNIFAFLHREVKIETPDPAYDHYLSADGPELTKGELSMYKQHQLSRGSNTYTYVRCYYALNAGSILDGGLINPSSSYVWAKVDGAYFKLSGYWYSGGLLEWKNMFYTDIPLLDIKKVCDETVRRYVDVNKFSFEQVAADNSFSFNHTIWQNDDSQDTKLDINKVISFGDSLSDINNIYNASQWKLPNSDSWFHGRFSNGRVWTEYLAQDLAVPLYNWAVGGAAGDTKYIVLPGLRQEVQSWIEYMSATKNYNPARSLFTVLIGANDFINYNRSVNEVSNDLKDSLTILAEHGARSIVLLNIPNVSMAPVFHMGKSVANLHENIIQYNKNITSIVADLHIQFPHLKVYVFDTYKMFNDALENPARYGIKNTLDPCLDINSNSSLNYVQSHDPRTSCSNPNDFIFWDNLHITTKVHRILATKVLESMLKE